MTLPLGTLVDTGPLFALVDAQGQARENQRCREALRSLEMPMVTTWPCLAEVFHLTGSRGGWQMQRLIGEMMRNGVLIPHHNGDDEAQRILGLMEQYRDRPMDLADASLVALAEAEGYGRIFSLDGDFYIYRLANGSALEVVPGPTSRR